MINWCGFSTKMEEKFGGPDDQKRSDISVFHPPDPDSEKEILDIVISSVSPNESDPTAISPAEAITPDRISSAAIRLKRHKYGAECSALGFGFEAISFESTGRPHPTTVSTLRKYTNYAARVKGLSEDSKLFSYWMAEIVFSLQKRIADILVKKCTDINSRQCVDNSINVRKILGSGHHNH